MGEVSTVGIHDAIPTNLPLPVLLFNAAMYQDIALSDFAEKIGIGALSLRQFIAGQTQRPRGKTLELLANVLNIQLEEARRRTTLRPISMPSFADWLKFQMNGRFSRAKLTRETRISDGALRNYLSGQTLPDTDQAYRLATALNISSLDIAQVIVADLTLRAGGETVPAPEEVEPPTPRGSATEIMPPDSTPISTMVTTEEPGFVPTTNRMTNVMSAMRDEDQILNLWRQLHPQARRAALIYISELLAEG